MKRTPTAPAALLLALLWGTLCIFALTGCRPADSPAEEDPIVASYRDQAVRKSLVSSMQQDLAATEGRTVSERDVIDQILLNLIMLDEAESRGLSVTPDEVDRELEGQKQNYENYEEVRKIIDEHCARNGIGSDEYFAALQQQLPRTILRQKLRDALGQEYCAAHGLEFTRINPPQQMLDYVQSYLDGLLDAHRADITYSDPD